MSQHQSTFPFNFLHQRPFAYWDYTLLACAIRAAGAVGVAICRVVTKAGWGRVCCCSVAELEAEGEPSPYHRGRKIEKLKDAAKSIENKIEIEENGELKDAAL